MDYLVPGRHTTHDVEWYKENTMGETAEGISIDQAASNTKSTHRSNIQCL